MARELGRRIDMHREGEPVPLNIELGEEFTPFKYLVPLKTSLGNTYVRMPIILREVGWGQIELVHQLDEDDISLGLRLRCSTGRPRKYSWEVLESGFLPVNTGLLSIAVNHFVKRGVQFFSCQMYFGDKVFRSRDSNSDFPEANLSAFLYWQATPELGGNVIVSFGPSRYKELRFRFLA